jgi:hypothetical protein
VSSGSRSIPEFCVEVPDIGAALALARRLDLLDAMVRPAAGGERFEVVVESIRSPAELRAALRATHTWLLDRNLTELTIRQGTKAYSLIANESG